MTFHNTVQSEIGLSKGCYIIIKIVDYEIICQQTGTLKKYSHAPLSNYSLKDAVFRIACGCIHGIVGNTLVLINVVALHWARLQQYLDG